MFVKSLIQLKCLINIFTFGHWWIYNNIGLVLWCLDLSHPLMLPMPNIIWARAWISVKVLCIENVKQTPTVCIDSHEN